MVDALSSFVEDLEKTKIFLPVRESNAGPSSRQLRSDSDCAVLAAVLH
jgi:hypothetical protein